MPLSGSPCPLQNAFLPAPCEFGLAVLPLHVCRPFSSGPSDLSVRWKSTGEIHEIRQKKRSIGSLQICFASTQSPKQPEAARERSYWSSLLPRTPIYSSSFADLDPIQLSELWLQTLRVRRDPEKIVKALRHSFAFVVVLAEDESASSTTGSGSGPRWKTVGVGRAVSDGSFIATICDVAVDPAYTHRGIGRRIVKKLVENMKRKGGPSGYAVFPPPGARRFFWMIGFRADRKYKLMAYREKTEDKITKPDGLTNSGSEGELTETE